MTTTKALLVTSLLALLMVPVALSAQEQPAAERGYVEFGFRYRWGDVYGRPDLLPFEPDLGKSKYEEYRDLRNGLFLRNLRVRMDDILGSKTYVALQSQKSFYRDQSYLATWGEYGRFKLQFRYDQIPHTYTNTSRTLYSESGPGVFTLPLSLRTDLETFPNNSTGLPSFLATSVVPTLPLIVPAISRKAGTGLFSFNLTPRWNVNVAFRRESEVGTRPIGLVLNSSPSASLTGGYGVELPEPIDYFTSTLKAGTEYAQERWAVQFGYLGSFFQNNVGELVFDNPFRTTDCLSPTGCTNATQGPATGAMDLYPDNQAHYLTFAGAADLGRYARFLASVSPGWLRQDDAFLPYTSNALRLAQTDPLPSASLGGSKRTLAMNYTVVSTFAKNFQLKAAYRHYDYNNDTPVREFTPVQGDAGAPDVEDNGARATSYFRKTFELTGNWFFAKRSSLKVGYEGEWLQRTHRDVPDSAEHSLVAAVDLSPVKDLLFRVSYRHSNREPDLYEDEAADGVECEASALAAARAALEFPEVHPCARRFDEDARIRDRADVLVQYSPIDRLTVSAFGGTLQDDFNRPGGSNSATPLNFLTGAAATTGPYYLYGLLKDISFNYGFDLDFAIRKEVSVFGEYSHERYHKRMISRYRQPEGTTGSSGCGPNSAAQANRGPCDSANNDWESTSRDLVDIWAAGLDLYPSKKVYVTAYYTLSAAQGHVDSRALGIVPPDFQTVDTPAANLPDRFKLTTTNAAVDYPETVSRTHEVTAIFKYKLTKNLLPRVEYRYQQFDNQDYQTTPMTQYQGCVSPLPPGAPLPGCPNVMIGTPSSFYPYFVVGDTSAARYLFLGVDQPSYRVHYFAATLEYHF